MSATAAAGQLEAREERDLLAVVNRLNSGIHAVSGGNRYGTLLLKEIDERSQSVRYVNCGHNPALPFQPKPQDVVPMNSSCFPIGMFDKFSCAINPARLHAGDVMVPYTDGVTEAENSLGDEFGVERLATLIRHGHTLSADVFMNRILENITDFSRDVGFEDDATILVVKFTFDSM